MLKEKIKKILKSKIGACVVTGVICLVLGTAMASPQSVETSGSISKELEEANTLAEERGVELNDNKAKITELTNKVTELEKKVKEAAPWFEMAEEERKAEQQKLDEEKAAKEEEERIAKEQADAEAKAKKEAEEQAKKAAESATTEQKNALSHAKKYLDYTAFSRTGLIEQLEYEGYSTESATYAVDNCGADWMKQAESKAKDYMEYTSFSKDGLIEQLKYEGFTDEQAVHGAESVGY